MHCHTGRVTENMSLPIKISSSATTLNPPQHQLHNLDCGPYIASMGRVIEIMSWQKIQLMVHTNYKHDPIAQEL